MQAVINTTEKRSVLHTALRAAEDESIVVDGVDVVKDVYSVRKQINAFAEGIRSGAIKGYSGKPLTSLIVIGIGGSYLSIEFVYEAVRFNQEAQKVSEGRTIRFLANVDPTDFVRAVEGLDPETTLAVINSKTFTTAETMLNARNVRNWLVQHYQQKDKNATVSDIARAHMAAVSTNMAETGKFGIAPERVFGFWDWVGGRYSVWSAIGLLPLTLHFGEKVVNSFLEGGRAIDRNFRYEKNVKKNLGVLLGLIGFYNLTVENLTNRAILPYSQAMMKFVPHIQQLEMESNGKSTTLDGEIISEYPTSGVVFGEPGTNGQHSFYQMIHQGTTPIPAEFIGFSRSQTPINRPDEKVANHQELMSNFFSQPDALACGKTREELEKEKVPAELMVHKFFSGNKPSISILMTELTPYTCGQILALYEHRTSIEGFIWGINSFDQYGVELGKVLAVNVRNFLAQANIDGKPSEEKLAQFNPSTRALLLKFLEDSK